MVISSGEVTFCKTVSDSSSTSLTVYSTSF